MADDTRDTRGDMGFRNHRDVFEGRLKASQQKYAVEVVKEAHQSGRNTYYVYAPDAERGVLLTTTRVEFEGPRMNAAIERQDKLFTRIAWYGPNFQDRAAEILVIMMWGAERRELAFTND